MAGVSNIEWTEHTWNPIVGCTIVSPGCINCYAMRMARRLELMSIGTPLAGKSYGNLTKVVNGNPVWTGALRFVERALTVPLKRKKPTTYFVNSMGDLFHEDCPDEWIDKVFAVMALSPQHTFQVLTKRAERMREYLCGENPFYRLYQRGGPLDDLAWRCRERSHSLKMAPLPNVWLGVSAERQQEADERIPLLLQTPAAVRFVSAEPLLGPIDLTEWLRDGHPTRDQVDGPLGMHYLRHGAPRLDWIIVGGESGPRAREHDLQWSRDLIAQCKAAGVAVFEKQLGANVVGPHANGVNKTRYTFKSPKGGDWSEWPEDLRVREFPVTSQSRSEAA